MKRISTTTLALAFIANEVFFDGNNADVNFTPADDMGISAEDALTAADIPKNPGLSVNVGGLPYAMSRRQSVSYDEIEYSSAGRILRNGRAHCSGNAITLEEYETVPENGILVSTAAHCFENIQPDDEYVFVLDYMDENNIIRTYNYSAPQIWANPRNIPGIAQTDVDQAFMFFAVQNLPDDITPARLEIYSEHVVRDFSPYYFNDIDITAAGYSQDMFGLSRDTDCRITAIHTPSIVPPYLRTNCQIYHGGSGSGLLFENFENENPDQRTIGATTASISTEDIAANDFSSYYTLYFHHNLAEVPFLRREDICARVTAENGLYVRSENYNERGSAYTSLPFNEVVYVTDMLHDEQERYGSDDVWLQIRKRDNPDPATPDGYSNSAWLEEPPCPPAP